MNPSINLTYKIHEGREVVSRNCFPLDYLRSYEIWRHETHSGRDNSGTEVYDLANVITFFGEREMRVFLREESWPKNKKEAYWE